MPNDTDGMQPAIGHCRPERVVTTPVPGIVLWRFPRSTLRTGRGEKRRSRYYVVTHEQSGVALLSGANGCPRVHTTMKNALVAVEAAGDIRWRGKPFDWTQPIEAIRANQRVKGSLLLLAGWLPIIAHHDETTTKWAARHGLRTE